MAASEEKEVDYDQLCSMFGVPESDCRVLVQEYKDSNDIIMSVFEGLESENVGSVAELVKVIQSKYQPSKKERGNANPAIARPRSQSGEISQRSMSANGLSNIDRYSLSPENRSNSAASHIDFSYPFNISIPFCGTRNPVQIHRIPEGIEADILRLYISCYMQDSEIRRMFQDLSQSPTNKFLILMRGVSGSGKSTLASTLWAICKEATICSADHFFINRQGEYNFNPNQLPEAHASSKEKCRKEVERGVPVIIIDNTNTRKDEMQPYVDYAVKKNYDVRIMVPNTSWNRDINMLTKKCVHNVQKQTIKSQLSRFEKTTDIALITSSLRRLGMDESNYQPNGKLDWGYASSTSSNSSNSSWTKKTAGQPPLVPTKAYKELTLDRPGKATAAFLRTKAPPKLPPYSAVGPPSSPPTRLCETNNNQPTSPPVRIEEEVPASPKSQRLLFDFIPSLDNGNDVTPKPKRGSGSKRKNSGNSNSQSSVKTPPSEPAPPLKYDAPLLAAFQKLCTLFPSVSKKELEELFETHKGDLDRCASDLIEKGIVMADDVTDSEHRTGSDSCHSCVTCKSDLTPYIVETLDSHFDETIENVLIDAETFNKAVADQEKKDKFKIELSLPIDFATGLVSAYGSTADEDMDLSLVDLKVSVSSDMAFQLFELLYANMHNKDADNASTVSSDNSVASESSKRNYEEDLNAITISLCQMDLETSSGDPNLATIMDVESKLQQQSQEMWKNYAAPNRTMAQNIIFCLLKQEFSGLDAGIIDDVYTQSALNFETARQRLEDISPNKRGGIPIQGPRNVDEDVDDEWILKYSPKDVETFSLTDLEDMKKRCDELEEAWKIKFLKVEEYHSMSKNQTNFQLKAHYIREATSLSQALKMLDKEIQYYKAVLVNSRHARQRNEQRLDLHTLNVAGALATLKQFLEYQEKEFEKAGTPKMLLLIITGRGKHSKNAASVLFPIVKNYLQQRQYKCYTTTPGTITIVLHR